MTDRPFLDYVDERFRRLSFVRDGPVVSLPETTESTTYRLVLSLDLRTQRDVARADLWTACLPGFRLAGDTLGEHVEKLGGELTAQLRAGAAVVAGRCPTGRLDAVLAAVSAATSGPGPDERWLRDTTEALRFRHVLRQEKVSARATAVARRLAFVPDAALRNEDLDRQFTAWTPDDIGHAPTHGWLVVHGSRADVAAATRFGLRAADPADDPPAGGQRYGLAEIVGTDRDQPTGAIALASSVSPVAGYWENVLVATALGGFFSARLWENLRERHSHCYSPHSSVEHCAAGAYALISAGAGREHIAAAIREIRRELVVLCEKGMSGAEFEDARRYLVGSLLRSVSGHHRLMEMLTKWLARGREPEHLRECIGAIAATDPSGAIRAARETFSPSRMCLAVCSSDPAEVVATVGKW